MEQYDYIDDLCKFLDSSPVNFLAVDTVRRRLDAEGFERLDPREAWEINRGGRYYVTKNDSAIFAFTVGDSDPEDGFRIIAAHSDSPGFRIKPNCEILCDGNIVKLNTEVYGGPILYTWFDRPLSIAGRVMMRGQDPLHPISRLVRFDRPLLTIPHLAIHFNRSVNDGNPLSKQKDMLPVIGRVNAKGDEKGLVKRLVAEELNVDPEIIIDYDLSLFDTTPACITGINGEFVTSGRIDDLSMVHAALTSLLEAGNDRGAIKVMAIFDNEETGSGTKQGAASPVLRNILKRICNSLGWTDEAFMISIASSFMISADNAHAVHPNYVEKQDPTNHPTLGGGPVIKINANCKYMTDADSAAVFKNICDIAGIPCQYFVNHSDVAGGSTLGNILTAQLDLRGVDMGAGVWAMHSVRETASTADHISIIKAFCTFYEI